MQCQPVLFFASQARRRVRFDGGILSTVKEFNLDKNGEKVKLKKGNYKTRKIDTVDWNEQGKAEEWRKSWVDITNKYLEENSIQEKDALYSQITDIRKEVEQAESVRSCIDKLLQEKRGLTKVKK